MKINTRSLILLLFLLIPGISSSAQLVPTPVPVGIPEALAEEIRNFLKEAPSETKFIAKFSRLGFPLKAGNALIFLHWQEDTYQIPRLRADFLPQPESLASFEASPVHFIIHPLSPEVQGSSYAFLKTPGSRETQDPLNSFVDYRKPLRSRVILPGYTGSVLKVFRNWKYSREGTVLLPRDIFVWLPPGYFTSPELRYPVMYFHDGQHIWDSPLSARGGMKAEKAATDLIAAGEIPPLLLVGVAQTARRGTEFLGWQPVSAPSPLLDSLQAESRDYADFIALEVKPWIDQEFRTNPSRESTGILGVSDGSTAAFYLAGRYPGQFSKIAGLSGAGAYNLRNILDFGFKPENWTIYLDCGGQEMDRYLLEAARGFTQAFEEEGFIREKNLFFREFPNHGHHEGHWALRIPEILTTFYGNK